MEIRWPSASPAGRTAVKPFVSEAEGEWLERVSKIDPASLPQRIRMNLPDWIYEALATRFAPEELVQLAASLNYPAPLDLRSNPIKASRDERRAVADKVIDNSGTRADLRRQVDEVWEWIQTLPRK